MVICAQSIFSPTERPRRAVAASPGRSLLPGLLLAWSLVGLGAMGQSVNVEPPVLVADGKTFPASLFRPTETVRITWTPAAPGMVLKIGDFPGEYRRTSRSVSGLATLDFTPGSLNLPVGIYSAVLTTAATAETQAEIQAAARNDPSILYSRDFQLVVESPVAPTIIGPRGTVTTPTPTFRWEGIPGVPAYVVAISSTPFKIGTQPGTNDPIVEGLTPVWGALTTETFARYGQPSPGTPFPNLPAPPLVPGKEYYYTVVNAYSKTEAALLSDAFAGVVAFRYEAFTGLLAPVLIAPPDGARFVETPGLTFEWEPVAGAASYTFTLSERRNLGGNTADVPIFSLTTPSTSVEVDAFNRLRRAVYTWTVIPNEANGAAGLPSQRMFNYRVPMGAFRYRPISTVDGAALLGVNVSVENLDGRHAPQVPLINPDPSYADSLVVGRYVFHASRPQFADTSVAVVIQEEARTTFELRMRPLPARLSGRVQDQRAQPVENARVVVSSTTGFTKSVFTDSQGRFSLSISPGTYRLVASRDGYIDAVREGVSVGPDGQVDLAAPLVIQATAGFVNGRIVNESGRPVQLARVIATSGSIRQEAVTDGDGVFDLTLAAGTWSLTGAKEGFLGGRPVQLAVAAGENIANIIVVLTERASQVSGSVLGVSYDASGQPIRRVLVGATVEAVPSVGTVLTAQTDDGGRFVLALGSGSYTIRARASGHLASSAVDLRLGLAESVTGLELELTAARTSVAGQVVDPLGAPVAGARVSVDLETDGSLFTETDLDGRFQLNVAPGTRNLTASAAGYESARATVGLSQGESQTGVRLVLVPGAGEARGRVTRSGVPIPRALVTARSASRTVLSRSGDDGTYRLGLPAGTWTLTATAAGHTASPARTLVLQPGQAVEGVNFELLAREAVLEGIVTSGGVPVAAAVVTVRGGSRTLRTPTRGTGLFSVAVEPGKALTIAIERSGYVPAAVEVPALSDLETRSITVELLPVATSISGVIRTTAGGVLPGVSVEARQSLQVWSTNSGPDGAYVLPVPAGSYELTVTFPGYVAQTRTVTLAVGERRSGVDFQMAPAYGTFVLTTVDGSGVLISGVDLVLESGSLVRTARTGLDGRTALGQLPPGGYLIRASRSGFRSITVGPRILADGATVEETIVMDRLAGSLSGRVLGTGDAPVRGALVRVAAGRQTLTGADGHFVLEGLEAGLTEVEISATGYQVLRLPAVDVLGDGTPTLLGDVHLVQHAGTLRGTVVTRDTRLGIAEALVTLGGDGGTSSTRTDGSGAFAFSSLAVGTYALEVTASGFRTLAQVVVIPDDSVVDLILDYAVGRISGSVTDPQGAALAFPVRVVASASGRLVATTTDSQGHFVLSGLDNGLVWTVRTEINRPGYVNAQRETAIPAEGSVSGVALVVGVHTATVNGNAGTPRAAVRIVDPASGATRALTQSGADGGFAFSLLPPGPWRVVPEKSGFTFTPAFVDLTLTQGGSGTATFSATSSVGAIQVLVVNVLRQPVPAVNVALTSEDGLVVRAGLTGGNGVITFGDLPLGRTYLIRPSKSGFYSAPLSASLSLSSAQTLQQTFTLIEATGILSGSVRSEQGAAIASGTATAIHLSTGVQYQAPVSSGAYRIERLPGGTYELTVQSDGFRSAKTQVTIAEGEARSGVDFTLKLASVILQGRVVYRGRGLQDATVRAVGRSVLEVRTDVLGKFVFPALPLDRPAPDTTAYQLVIGAPEGATATRTVRIPPDRLGQVVTLPDIVLSSGEIRVEVDDGAVPLAGVAILIERPDGDLINGTTDSEGWFRSGAHLPAGAYRVEPSRAGYLQPSGTLLGVGLASDTSLVSLAVSMPYRFNPPQVVSTQASTEFRIAVTPGYDLSGVTGHLRYRTGVQEEQSVPLSIVAGSLVAYLPAQLSSAPITYTVSVSDIRGGLIYGTGNRTIEPVAPGSLASLRVEPALDGARLRTGDVYSIRLVPRDGTGASLNSRFAPGAGGILEWALSRSPEALTFPDPTNRTLAEIRVVEAGDYRLNVTAVLDGARITLTPEFVAGSFQPERISITVPEEGLDNQSSGVQLSYRAETADGGSQLLGSGLSWSVAPPEAGRISPGGLFVPSDPSFIGPVTVTVRDAGSGISSSAAFSLYRRLSAGTGVRLRDAAGTILDLAPGSIPFSADIGLSHPPLIGPKRNATPIGESARFTVGEQLVRFSMRSDRALLNDSLLIPAVLTLPPDPSLALVEGTRTIGRFDVSRLRWRLEASEPSPAGVTSPTVSRLSEFGLLAPNQALGLEHVAVLPNPFSPDIAPLRIGYLLTTQEPPATVSIRVFSVRGELIRTLLSEEPQEPGRYGSRSSRRELVWDGRTDAGSRARNGRYIIEIRASDASGSTIERISVVLVK